MPSSFRGQLRYAGVIAAIAPLSVLTGCGEANRAEKSAQPGKAQPVTLGKPRLVETPRESPPGVAVSVPLSYTPPTRSRATHRTQVTARVIVQDGSGRRWELTARPGADSRRILPVAPGHQTVYSHLFLSDSDARTVQTALGAGGSATVTARAAVATDSNGDGKVDSTTATAATATTKKLTPASQAVSDEQRGGTRSLGLVGDSSDPCDNAPGISYALDCQNIKGNQFKANRFLESTDETISCPSGYYIVPKIELILGGDPLHSVITTSHDYSATASWALYSKGAHIIIIDHNLYHHPYYYTPVLACCKPDPSRGSSYGNCDQS
jgi:hypothetical protein